MLAGVRYEVAQAAMIAPLASTRLTDTSEVRSGLAAHGIRLGKEVRCDDWDRLLAIGQPLLVAVNYVEAKRSNWHWMVFDPSRPDAPVLDPNAMAPKAIDRRTHLFSYFHLWRNSANVL